MPKSSTETEVRTAATIRAEPERAAIRVFTGNLRKLLLARALGKKNTLAHDTGFRSGCKMASLDRQGCQLHYVTVYPLPGGREEEEGAPLCRQYQIDAITVGNDAAGRETEAFLRTLELELPIPVVIINASGTSVCSVSAPVRGECANHDTTVRGRCTSVAAS